MRIEGRLRDFLIFSSGFGLGGGLFYLITRHIYIKKTNDEIDLMTKHFEEEAQKVEKAAYESACDVVKDLYDSKGTKFGSDSVLSVDEYMELYSGGKVKEIPEVRSMEDYMAEAEHPEEDEDEDDDGYSGSLSHSESYLRERNEEMKMVSDSIYLISGDDYLNGRRDFEKVELDYYVLSDSLVVSESDEEVFDIERVVGDCLDVSRFKIDEDVPYIHVRNLNFGCDYQIGKFYKSFNIGG